MILPYCTFDRYTIWAYIHIPNGRLPLPCLWFCFRNLRDSESPRQNTSVGAFYVHVPPTSASASPKFITPFCVSFSGEDVAKLRIIHMSNNFFTYIFKNVLKILYLRHKIRFVILHSFYSHIQYAIWNICHKRVVTNS